MSPGSGALGDRLTSAQLRLLERHRRGLVRLGQVLAAKTGRAPTDIMFVLAHEQSNVGSIAREQLGQHVLRGTEGVVIPGLATELPKWIERLALTGPVHDCTRLDNGVPVIVVDERDEIALCGLRAVSSIASALN